MALSNYSMKWLLSPEFDDINLHEITIFLLFKIHLWMKKWIYHAAKSHGHSDYREIITQICGSNNFYPDFGQRSSENIAGKKPFRRMFRLRRIKLLHGMFGCTWFSELLVCMKLQMIDSSISTNFTCKLNVDVIIKHQKK